MQNLLADGQWHTGSENGTFFAGKLQVDDDEGFLTLGRDALQTMLGGGTPMVGDELFTARLPTMFGLLLNGPDTSQRRVCLFGNRVISIGLDQVRVCADAVTFGFIAPSSDAFTELTLEFDWLRAWVGPEHLVAAGGPDDESLTLDLAERILCQAKIPGGQVALVVNNPYRTGHYSVSVSREVHVRVTLDKPITWRQCLDAWARLFQDLLIIAIGKPVQLTAIHIRPETPNDRGRVELVARTNRGTPEMNARGASLSSYTSPVLMPCDDFIARFDELINRWITVADTYIDTIVRLTAPANARFMYLDNRCAFIAQALEAFHNKTWSKKELPTSAHRARVSRILEALEKSPVQLRSEELDYACKVLQSRNAKSWAEMVADVLDFASDLGLLIRRTLPGFPTLAEGIRHSVSHGPRSGQAKEVGITEEEHLQGRQRQLSQRHFAAELLEWTLRVAILKQVGYEAGPQASENTNVAFALRRLTMTDETTPST
jgi:hypothetical protein